MPALMARGGSHRRRSINEINMVPFIDVMLVLLIIFMVTAPLITPSLIDLPSVGKANKQPDVVIQIIIDKNEALELKVGNKSTPVTNANLLASVRSAQGGNAATPVVISGDRSIKYESVVKVMDTLQRAGIQRVGLSVKLTN